MKTTTKFRVMWVNPYGRGEINEDGFDTPEQAKEYCDDLKENFPEHDYYCESYEAVEPRHYNNGAVDGWEDMFPSYDDY